MQPGPKSILIVDNEPHVCLLIGDELSRHGFDCHSVADPVEASEIIKTDRYDLIITDISMPKVSGLELLILAKQYAPKCKVILTTGLSSREYLAQALVLGAYDYVEKPFEMDELVETVRSATGGEDEIPQLPMRAAEAMQLGRQSKQIMLDSVRALSRAVEAKDPYTRRHSENVTHYATNMAESLGATEEMAESVRVGALLHDIGKIGVPDHILTKPGRLTDDEFEYIRRHPALGADIISNITLFGQVALLVRHHHENWDGSGYTDGLTGEEIPWGARIINIADSIDAMLMKRTYKDCYTVDKMLDELARCAETQFDPRIAEAAIRWCRKNPNRLIMPNRSIELPA